MLLVVILFRMSVQRKGYLSYMITNYLTDLYLFIIILWYIIYVNMIDFIKATLTPLLIIFGLINPSAVEEPVEEEVILRQEIENLQNKIEELENQRNPVEIDVEPKKVNDENEVTPIVESSTDYIPEINHKVERNEPSVEVKEDTQTETIFSFKDIEVETTEKEVVFSWQTSLPSESRIVIHRENLIQNIFPSNTTLGTDHNVTITGLSSSRDYTYEVIAKNDEKEISRFDTFYTKREFTVRLLEKNEECIKFIVKDTMDKPLINGSFTIQGDKIRENSINKRYSSETVATDEEGIFEYCKNANQIRITDSEGEEVYQLNP